MRMVAMCAVCRSRTFFSTAQWHRRHCGGVGPGGGVEQTGHASSPFHSPAGWLAVSFALALCLCAAPLAAADYTLDWDAVAPGGGTSTSGDGRFVLVDTLGQPDAGVATNEVHRWDAGFVAGLNLPPQPGADAFQRATNRTAKVRLATLLANDSDPDADALTLTSLDAATAHGGTVTLDAGWVCYVPPANFNGADSFAYILTDAEGHRATNTVTIQMEGDAGGQTRNLVAIATLPNGHKLITVAGIAGRTNIIQWKADLGDPEWQSLPTPGVLGPNGLLEYEDTTEPAPPQRYYRTVTR